MSINKYQTSGFTPGQGECIVQIISQSWRKNYISNVAIEFTDISHPSEQTEALKKAETKGHLYLTNKQLVWVNKLNNKLREVSFFKLRNQSYANPQISGRGEGGSPFSYSKYGKIRIRKLRSKKSFIFSQILGVSLFNIDSC